MLNVVMLSVVAPLWQLKTVVFLHWCLICDVILSVSTIVIAVNITKVSIVSTQCVCHCKSLYLQTRNTNFFSIGPSFPF